MICGNCKRECTATIGSTNGNAPSSTVGGIPVSDCCGSPINENPIEPREYEDKFYCTECCSFTDKNHRCEQWSNVIRIPARAVRVLTEGVFIPSEMKSMESLIKTQNHAIEKLEKN